MKRKLVGILICMLLMATTILPVAGNLNNNIFSDNFNDCDISDWTVSTAGSGVFETSTTKCVSAPCSAHMKSLNLYDQAMGVSPTYNLDTSEDYDVSFYFLIPSTNNHWFEVFNNHQTYLLIDSNTQLKWYDGSSPHLIMSLSTNQWYYIEIELDQSSDTYDVYINSQYMATCDIWTHSGFVNNFRIGDRNNDQGSYFDYGEAYWDDFQISQIINNPPNTPSTPSGPTSGYRNVEYSYSTSTTDPDGDNIYYLFDWDDGSSQDWYGPYNSGQTCTQSHEWTDLGSYDVKVKAKDQYNEESGWSNPLTVTINNQLPDADPNGPYVGEEGETILFDGSGSSDPDGSITSYEWSYTIGYSLPVYMGTGEFLEYAFDEAGDYVIRLTVTDNDNGVDYDTTTATIELGMIVNHHGPYSGFIGETIQFYGSAENGEPPYSWLWDFGDNTYSNEQNTVHVYDAADVFYVFLYVTDSSGTGKTVHTTATIKPAPLTVEINGPYYGTVNEDIQFTSTVAGGTPPYEYLWTFGDNCSSTEENPAHQYTLYKTYDVTLTVTDSMMTSANNSTKAIILQELNSPPDKPELYGPAKGKPGILYTYFANTTDPNGDQVSYAFDWGIADQIIVWQGPYDSGVTINSSIAWSEEGKYTVCVKARDTYKAESDWSDPIEVSMPKNYVFNPWYWLYNIMIKYFPILQYILI